MRRLVKLVIDEKVKIMNSDCNLTTPKGIEKKIDSDKHGSRSAVQIEKKKPHQISAVL
jgi:hypothetical protein